MIVPRESTSRRTWLLAGLLTLALHGLALLLAQQLGLRVATPVAAAEPELLHVVFRPDEPRTFTELPEDRKDEPPEQAELLSNVDSRARDRSGGNTNAPRLEGPADAPQVRIAPGAETPDAAPPESDDEASGRSLVLRSSPRPSMADLARDLPQDEGSRPEDGALLSGDISLSTTAWEYAPWLSAFRRAVMDHWYPPAAYHMGLIHGWCVLDLDVGRDGAIRALRVVDDDVGHHSLTSAAVLALQGAAPYRPLPASFPDESLGIRIRFTYPKLPR